MHKSICSMLLALQVNNWNQERIENQVENEILTSLLSNLKEDEISLKQHSGFDSLRAISVTIILEAINGKVPSYSAEELTRLDMHYDYRKNVGQVLTGEWKIDFPHMLRYIVGSELSFQPRDMAYKSLTQGENSAIIDDKSLLNSISSYYNSAYYINRAENTLRNNITHHFKRMILSDNRLTSDFNYFMSQKSNFENWLIDIESNASWQKSMYDSQLRELRGLKKKIEFHIY